MKSSALILQGLVPAREISNRNLESLAKISFPVMDVYDDGCEELQVAVRIVVMIIKIAV
jgi:hypothetical protein